MDSEDICLSVFLCICVGEGMGGKNKLSVPSRTCESGYVRQNQVDYTLHLCTPSIPGYRGVDKDFAVISLVDTGTSGRRKRFCQNRPRGYRTSGAQQEILPG